MPVDLYCYACRTSSYAVGSGEDGPPACPACASEFVEILDRPSVGVQPHPEGAGAPPFAIPPDFPGGATFAPGAPEGPAPPGLEILQHIFSALASQGVQVAVQGPGGNAIGGFNLGDFAGGSGMEDLLNRLMEQHQPRNEPTSQETLAALPRRKVPAAAGQPGNGTYVAGSACKAGETCTVCHSEFEAEGEVIQLPCDHCFHADCILPWLELHHTCPICRAELPAADSPPRGPDGPAEGAGGPPGGGVLPPQFRGLNEALGNLASLLVPPPGGGGRGGPVGGGLRTHAGRLPAEGQPEGGVWARHMQDAMRRAARGEAAADFGDDLDEDEDGGFDSEEEEEEEEYESEAEVEPEGGYVSGEQPGSSEWETDHGGIEPEDGDLAGSGSSEAEAAPAAPIAAAGGAAARAAVADHFAAIAAARAGRPADQQASSSGGGAEAKQEGNEGLARGGGRPLGLVGAMAAPVGWLVRGAWHLGSRVLGRFV